MADMSRTYTVTGMTCSTASMPSPHEVSAVGGVEAVAVDLATGRVTVTGAGYTDEQIAAAVDEAGYELADA